jgi:hypothetical protein
MPKTRKLKAAVTRWRTGVVTAGALIVTVVGGTAAPAHATPAYTTASASQQCLSFVLRNWGLKKQLWAYNSCSSERGFSVRRAGTFQDEVSPCITVHPYKWAGWEWPRGRAYKSHTLC